MSPKRASREVLLGTSGWSYPGWRGVFYPPGLPSRRWLEFYAGRFPTVEINMTFYRLPSPAMLTGWSERTPPDFCFTLKASRLITHLKKIRDVKEDVDRFYGLAEILGKKLGCILFQLPPFLTMDLGLFSDFLAALPAACRNVIEFRHPSWYDERVFELMRKRQTALCIVPSGQVPTSPVETSDVAYVRFHGPSGRYDASYSDAELAGWAETIGRLRAAERFVYFNNDYRGFAVQDCLRLREMLGGRGTRRRPA
jgi:uncharacterized protein YecE (DUF72 family)